MKFILKTALSILLVFFFLAFSISATIKFQILKISFWENTFQLSGSYVTLSEAVIDSLEMQVLAGGGTKDDIAVFTDLATAGNLKDLVNRNIENFLNYVNGKSKEAFIYVPVGRLPKSLLPEEIGGIGQQIGLASFLNSTGVASVSASQIQKIQNTPRLVNLAFFASIVLMILTLAAFFALTEQGKRFGFAGFAMVASGGILSAAAKLIDLVNTGLFQSLVQRKDLGGVIVGVMAPPIITEISKVWLIIGIVAMVIGVILFFVKKPYNNLKKP
jgi:hypothetical protein